MANVHYMTCLSFSSENNKDVNAIVLLCLYACSPLNDDDDGRQLIIRSVSNVEPRHCENNCFIIDEHKKFATP